MGKTPGTLQFCYIAMRKSLSMSIVSFRQSHFVGCNFPFVYIWALMQRGCEPRLYCS